MSEPARASDRPDVRPGPPLAELSRVVITAPATTIEGDAVPAGTAGTIVFVIGEGIAYDVEFAGALGPATLPASDVRPLP